MLTVLGDNSGIYINYDVGGGDKPRHSSGTLASHVLPAICVMNACENVGKDIE